MKTEISENTEITKTPSDSFTVLTNIILPSETNSLNNIFGGGLISRMGRIGSIAARRHAGADTVVTAYVNGISFDKPIQMGKIAVLFARVSRSFTTSMEVIIDVFEEDTKTGEKTKTNQGIFTFVAVDSTGKPIKVPRLVPETKEEEIHFTEALQRRELNLIRSGRLNPKDAPELKKLFI